jgi:putative transposase
VEDLLAERGVIVSYESIPPWCQKFGIEYARGLRRRQGRLGDTWYLDELFVTIQGQRQYLWRAIDQDGDVIDLSSNPVAISLQLNDSFVSYRRVRKGNLGD